MNNTQKRVNALKERAVKLNQLIWKPTKNGETIAGEVVEIGSDIHPIYGEQGFLTINENEALSQRTRVILPHLIRGQLLEKLSCGDLVALTYEGKCRISGLSHLDSYSYMIEKA